MGNRGISFERYRELLDGGPVITEADIERMKGFQPKPAVMCFAVRFALFAMRSGNAAR